MSLAQTGSNLFSWDNFSKADDLKKRIWFTLFALVVYRLGTFIPLPGINPVVLSEIFSQNRSGILGLFDLFTGGALGRMTLFALNVVPYISASIIMQLMTSVMPSLDAIKKEGEEGRRKINQYTRYLTVLITMAQGYGIAVGLESLVGSLGPAVAEPGIFFRFIVVLSLVGGTLFLMWIGEQITSRGIGNGISLIIFSGIVSSLPGALAAIFELGRTGAIPVLLIVILLILSLAVIGVIVMFERAFHKVTIQYPKRQVGNRIMGGDQTHMPLKVNMSGVIPAIFATSLLFLPISLANLNLDQSASPEWFIWLNSYFGRGKPLYLFVFAALIVFFAFVYTAVVFNPKDTADNLRRYGGIVPGYRPGQQTASYFDYLTTRLTVVGSAYLVVICLLPEFLISQFAVPFYFGGTSLLIVVSVTLDTVSQIQGHLYSKHYDKLMKQSKQKR